MAKKKPTKGGKASGEARLLESALGQFEEVWMKGEKRFTQAMDDSGRDTIVLHFNVTLDKSNPAPVVDVTMSFKDKCKESGMEVIKTFKVGTSEELDDENQGKLPGVDPKESGKMAAAGEKETD